MSTQPVDYLAMLMSEIRCRCVQDRPYVIHVAEVTVEMQQRGEEWIARLTTTGGYSGSYTRSTWEAAHIEILVDAERRVKNRIPASAWVEDEPRREQTGPCGIVVSTEEGDTVSMKRSTPGANRIAPARDRVAEGM